MKLFLQIIFMFSLVSCGGGDGESTLPSQETKDTDVPISNNSKVGFLIDSAISGVNYKTETQSGITGSNGEFSFLEGEKVTFSIGSLVIAETDALELITPLDIFTSNDINTQAVVNFARLLQTLDDDADPSNGININEATHSAVTNIASINFENEFEAEVQTVLNSVGSTELVAPEQAKAHLQETLSTLPPKVFSEEYLSGKTLYMVTFGEGDLGASNSSRDIWTGGDVPVVSEWVFSSVDNSIQYTGLLNDNLLNEVLYYEITDSGILHITEDDADEGNSIVCGSTYDYIKTYYSSDNVSELFFFEKDKALEYAQTLTENIPLCNIVPVRKIPQATIITDGNINDWEGIEVALEDAEGDSPLGGMDVVALYIAQDTDNLYIRLDRASTDMPIDRALYSYNILLQSENESSYQLEFFHWETAPMDSEIAHIVYPYTQPQLFDISLPNQSWEDRVFIADINDFDTTSSRYLEVKINKAKLNTNSVFYLDFDSSFSIIPNSWGDAEDVESSYDRGHDEVIQNKMLFKF